MHGEQNGPIYQEVTLGGSDIAPVSSLAEDRADMLKCCINCKHGDHSSHLHLRHTTRVPSRLWAFVLTVGGRGRPGTARGKAGQLSGLPVCQGVSVGASAAGLR